MTAPWNDRTEGNQVNRGGFSVYSAHDVPKRPTMHPRFVTAAAMTRDVIGAAIEEHNDQDKRAGISALGKRFWATRINRRVAPILTEAIEQPEKTELSFASSVGSLCSCSNQMPLP